MALRWSQQMDSKRNEQVTDGGRKDKCKTQKFKLNDTQTHIASNLPLNKFHVVFH